ncbi:MAG: ribonuclease HII [Selenomonadaceae bacterium]|nr:ribonuclease HII [Selenomonadaceae bacterium]
MAQSSRKTAEIEALLQDALDSGRTLEAGLLAELAAVSRAAVQRLVRRYDRELAERQRLKELYCYEYEAQQEGAAYIAGVDEAGRGPLAGPVVVAAAILPVGLYIPKLNDSKKLSAKVRDELFDIIKEQAIAYSVAIIDEKTIDRDNIYRATVSGMYQVIEKLKPQPQKVLVDAVPLDKLTMPSLSLIKGDAKSASIAAASVLAKVTRDRLMEEYDREYPEYGFAKHKGYGTAEHMAALRKYGPCPIHRRSFAPVSEYEGAGQS